MPSLAVSYRPNKGEDIIGQESIVRILSRQISTGLIKNCYLFCGPSGDGKTTTARWFSNAVNGGVGTPVEIDAASNSGVDNVREIIKSANERALDGKYKIFIVDECVTGDTEILTDCGWKRFDSLDRTELIAQYNNGSIEFVKPDDYVEMDYCGDMYNVHIGNKATFQMSPNHVQPLLYTKSGKIREKYIKDVRFCQTNKLIVSGRGVGERKSLSWIDKLAICLQADGSLADSRWDHNHWIISVKKDRKKKNLIEILENCGLEYREINTNREGCVRFSVNTPKTITKKLQTHFNLCDMSYEYASEFIDNLMLWDGFVSQNKYYYYSCVDKENVDFCQCVGILGGYSSRVAVEVDNRSEKFNNCYRLYLQKRELSSGNQRVEKKQFEYDGKIYCVKVPSHCIIIRKDGVEMVTGNCHSLSSAAWQSFLKCIEEPPKYTIFIFCTTEVNKVPDTIKNRCQRFNFSRVSSNLIRERLNFICKEEGFTNYEETTDYISKICNGGVRDAISLLEKCASYDNDLSIENCLNALGNLSYDTFFNLINSIIDDDEKNVSRLITEYYNSGADIKLFVDQFLSFCLDVEKYCLFKSFDLISIPSSMEEKIVKSTNFDNSEKYYMYVIDRLLELKNMIKADSNARLTVEVVLLQIARGK